MGKKILVVEDNPDNLKLLSWILEDEGYEFEAVGSGEECLEITQSKQFALILMDISLPGMDGKEATMRLRSTEQYANVPILAVTAHAVKGESESILASGVNDLITKPLDEKQLLEALSSYIH